MMFVFAMTGNIQVTACSIREGFKEMKKHFRWHVPKFLSLEMCIPDDPVASPKIDQHFGVGLIHRKGKAIPFHAPLVRERPGEGR